MQKTELAAWLRFYTIEGTQEPETSSDDVARALEQSLQLKPEQELLDNWLHFLLHEFNTKNPIHQWRRQTELLPANAIDEIVDGLSFLADGDQAQRAITTPEQFDELCEQSIVAGHHLIRAIALCLYDDEENKTAWFAECLDVIRHYSQAQRDAAREKENELIEHHHQAMD